MNPAPPPIITSTAGLRREMAGLAPGLVPTMGALHAGHASLIARSASNHDATVVSIFVNPKQFEDADDFARYPQASPADVALAADSGATLIFAPTLHEMYPPGFATHVSVAGLGERWEGTARPGHFQGVATVVTRLIGLVEPARSYFGEKDFQQLQVVRRLHADLALPGEIVGCPTVRDDDGLALSSRNRRLTPAARRAATAIPRALARMVESARNCDDAAAVLKIGMAVLDSEPAVQLDYLAIVDPETLAPLTQITPDARAIVAAEVSGVRLIDNAGLHGEAP